MKKILITIVTILIMFAAVPAVVSADENAAQSVTAESVRSEDFTSGGITLEVSCTEAPRCGTPTNFSLKASGCDGFYKYRLGDVYDGNGNFLIDPQYQKYTDKRAASTDMSFTFYASGTYTLCFYAMGEDSSGTWKVMSRPLKITLKVSDKKYPSVEAKAKSVASKCIAAGCKTEFDKALWLHDWILQNCVYDSSYNYCNAEGALARGKGTCEAYHRAYEMLLDNVGIEHKRVEGNAHVWTALRIDGKWCQVDSTWDDSGYAPLDSYESHLYFGLDDRLMKMAHSQHTADPDAPCDTLQNNYFIRTGKVSSWSEPFKDDIRKALGEGKRNFSLKIENSSVYPQYWNVIYNIVAYDLSLGAWEHDGREYKLNATYDSAGGLMNFEAAQVNGGACEHKQYEIVKEDVVDSTYLAAGSYNEVKRCINCNGKFSSTSHSIAKKCGTELKSVKYKKSRKAVVKWTKNSKVSGYQVQYCRNAKFTSAKLKKVKGGSKTGATLSSLSKNTKYYIRVRTYTKSNYSGWSKVSSVRILK